MREGFKRRKKRKAPKGSLSRQVMDLEEKVLKKPIKPCTYIIEAKGTNTVKIGKSKTVFKRLAELQVGSAQELVLLRRIDGEHHEAILHRNLKQFLVRPKGEWYHKTPELVKYIDRYHRDDPNFCLLERKPVNVTFLS